MSSESLMEESLRVWQKLLNERSDRDPFLRLAEDTDFSRPEVTLGTDDFTLLMMSYAEELGIDLQEYGKKLMPSEKREDLLKYHMAIAFRTVFEVEGHYVEIPGAYTIYKVPTRFLIGCGCGSNRNCHRKSSPT